MLHVKAEEIKYEQKVYISRFHLQQAHTVPFYRKSLMGISITVWKV